MTVWIPMHKVGASAGHGGVDCAMAVATSAWPYGGGDMPPAFGSEQECVEYIKRTFSSWSNIKPQLFEVEQG